MTQPRVARTPYSYNGGLPAKYDRGMLAVEFQKIQRAIPVPSIKTVTTTYNASLTDSTILCDASGGAFTLTLPEVTACVGLVLTIKKIDSTVHAITIGGTVAIDGAVGFVFGTQYEARMIQSDGSQWYVLAKV